MLFESPSLECTFTFATLETLRLMLTSTRFSLFMLWSIVITIDEPFDCGISGRVVKVVGFGEAVVVETIGTGPPFLQHGQQFDRSLQQVCEQQFD
ncbi:hypothetical protein Trydic_g17083 [Trypoxylus dichotomus]